MKTNTLLTHVFRHQLKADEHKANLNINMLQFDERWNIVCDSLRHFANGH